MSNQTPSLKRIKKTQHARKLYRIFLLLTLISGFFLILFLYAQSSDQALPIPVDKEDVVISQTSEYIQDQMIVRFAVGSAPHILQERVDQRAELRKSAIGKARVVLENMQYRASSAPYPENQLKDIQNTLIRAGVVKQKKLYNSTALVFQGYYLVELAENSDLSTVQKILHESSDIDFAEPNYIVSIFEVPNDTQYATQWDMKKIAMEEAWDISTGGGVTAAVIDTGIDYNHSDLKNVNKGRDFSTCDQYSGPTCVAPKARDNDAMDDNGHGTHVAGTMGAATNNALGVAGINWDIELLAVKVLGKDGHGVDHDILEAMQYTIDFPGVRVINMSLGDPSPCRVKPAYQDVINYARSNDVIIVAAAGNDARDSGNYVPASCEGVITVGATDQSDRRSIWGGGHGSNYGAGVDLAAPGTGILSTYAGNKLATLDGTSMAAPHVAGAAALLLSVNGNLTPDQVKECLVEHADTIATDLPIGGKRLNVKNSLAECGDGGLPNTPTKPSTPTPSVSYRVSGVAFFDLNGNKSRESNEPIAPGFSLTMFEGPSFNNGPVTLTNSQGNYVFDNTTIPGGLDPGTYKIGVSEPETLYVTNEFTVSTAQSTHNVPIPLPSDLNENPQPTVPPNNGLGGYLMAVAGFNLAACPPTIIVQAEISGPVTRTQTKPGGGYFYFEDLPFGNYTFTYTILEGDAEPSTGSVQFTVSSISPFVNGGHIVISGCEGAPIPTIPVPTIPQSTATPTPSSTPTPTSSTQPPAQKTPTPTKRVRLYDCVERTDTKVVDGKPIQISWLDCRPI